MTEWTADQLKGYIDELRATDLAARKAALRAMEHRLDGMNEFRAQLDKQTAEFLTRDEFRAMARGIIVTVGVLAALATAIVAVVSALT